MNPPDRLPASAIVRWLFAAALAVGVGLAITRVAPPSDAAWAHALLTQKLQKAGARSTPAVLVIGGSGTHFGVSCGVIARELAQPCFNLGSHAGLGAATLLSSADAAVRAGDVVVIRLEHEVAADPLAEGPLGDAVRALAHLPLFDHVSLERDLHRVARAPAPGLRAVLRGVARKLGVTPSADAYALGTDDVGDPLALPDAPARVRDTPAQQPSAETLRAVSAFAARWSARGARVFAAPPLTQVASVDAARIAAARAALAPLGERLPLLLDDAASLSARPADFSDSPYHLRPSARERTSRVLAHQLDGALKSSRRD